MKKPLYYVCDYCEKKMFNEPPVTDDYRHYCKLSCQKYHRQCLELTGNLEQRARAYEGQ